MIKIKFEFLENNLIRHYTDKKIEEEEMNVEI